MCSCITSNATCKVTREMNDYLNKPYSNYEIKRALFLVR